MLERLESRLHLTTVTIVPAAAPTTENGGAIVFTATLDAPSATDVTIAYRTVNGSARAGADFESARATLVIPAGATSASGSIAIVDDEPYEPVESFGLAFSTNRGVKLAARRVTLTIADDAPVPTASVADVSVLEGNRGQANVATAQVMLSNPAAQAIRINYRTEQDSAATEGGDYRPGRGTIVFRPGQVVGQAKVRIVGDDAVEPDESFRIVVTPLAPSQIDEAFGTVTIVNDDSSTGGPLPFLSITGPAAAAEGSGALDFHISLTASSGSSLPAEAVSVNYATRDGTATIAGGDYVGATGTLTFAPGEAVKTVYITTTDDDVPEPDETFSVVLTQSANAIVIAGSATATLLNDDDPGEPLPPEPPPPPPPVPSVLIVSTASVQEGNLIITEPDPVSLTTTLQIPVTLSAPYAGNVTVAYQTGATGEGPGHADGGFDYAAIQGVLTFAAGQTANVISIAIAGDIEVELDETFTVTLLNPGNAMLGTATSVITIFNDDVPG